jgi:hypothetical protein
VRVTNRGLGLMLRWIMEGVPDPAVNSAGSVFELFTG